jgi:IS1 family transposase
MVEKGSGVAYLFHQHDRSAETINELIEDYIEPGTTIVTDRWRGYRQIPEEYTHLEVTTGNIFQIFKILD